ncbi:MAG TPA: alpha-glucosidase C-terminal domain-containing protein, partial [Micromonosporaceae bacterium]
ADLVDYFGDPATGGNECHMAFHFPLMPRIFMAVRRQNRTPITEIMAQTPQIPANCQWATFLRNHDELTLEMVTDADRDYLYGEYARDPRARLNLGIRRRLAPLVDNDRAQIELFVALLMSLPGSPVLYYGDEIGMGDNVWLGDRNSVRTPMQWSVDRNGGFSKCEPAALHLPVNSGWVYGYQAVNVEQQRQQPSSLLGWTRRMIQVRKRHPALAIGSYADVPSSNPAVLAFLRECGGDEPEVVLCVHNLSAYPQPAQVRLDRRFAGQVPVELTGQTRFPAVGLRPYQLTLPGYGSYLFRLVERDVAPRQRTAAAGPGSTALASGAQA